MPLVCYSTHFCIVSRNAIGNLTPLLDKRFRPKCVVLLERKGMQKYGDYLVSILQGIGITCQRVNITDITNFEASRQQVTDLLGNYSVGSVALNSSCGHRLLTLAAYTAFQQAGLSVFYVNPENDHLSWVLPENKPSTDLGDHLTIKQFLQLQGTQLVSFESDIISELFDPLFDELLSQVERFSKPLKVVNALATSARYSPSFTSQPLSVEQQYDNALRDLVDVFVKYECCGMQGDKLVFVNETARNFVNGGWLELFACRQVQKMATDHAEIQDVARNVEIRNGDQVNNEMDVVFLANNHLFLIECKTMDFAAIKGKMSFRKVKEKKRAAREQVYRMDSLKELHGGLHGEAMILSYHPLPKEAIQRAEDLGLCICASTDLLNFKTIVRDWALPKHGRIIEDAS